MSFYPFISILCAKILCVNKALMVESGIVYEHGKTTMILWYRKKGQLWLIVWFTLTNDHSAISHSIFSCRLINIRHKLWSRYPNRGGGLGSRTSLDIICLNSELLRGSCYLNSIRSIQIWIPRRLGIWTSLDKICLDTETPVYLHPTCLYILDLSKFTLTYSLGRWLCSLTTRVTFSLACSMISAWKKGSELNQTMKTCFKNWLV